MKYLSVIIVNYQTPNLTIEALQSLAVDMAAQHDWCAIVVDNFSNDSSVADIRSAIEKNGWKEWVRVIESPANGGFGSGNNLGIAEEQAEFYLLLNSDARVLPSAIVVMLSEMEKDPTVGLIGPRLQWPNGDPQVSCFRNKTPFSEFLAAACTGVLDRLLSRYVISMGLFESNTEAEWLSFACILIRGKTRGQLGGMDEDFFLYFEDIDYCRHARRAGWKVLHAPEARAIHLRGGTASLKKDTIARRRLPRYNFESRSRYFGKYYGGVAGVVLANMMWMAGRLLAFIRESMGNKLPHVCDSEIKDNWINWDQPKRTSSYLSGQNRP